MGHRLSRITTRTGDDGTTGLGDGTRVPKDSRRIEAIGAVDEANCALGVVLAQPVPEEARALLVALQHALFDLGAELAVPGHAALQDADAVWLERELARMNASLPPLREFVLPGGGAAAAYCHVARAAARRAERAMVALGRGQPLRPEALRFVNRLSDLLFVLARVLARGAGGEVLWDPALGQERRR
ncbi:cob(I)yrinic acid a,c-diamide adenosyltransferase [Coralloluteibacterium thermophilus]|uniref:Corrinoid adenosyltransferase n=1 Tax=Coralloluteibacterium thermophilum TaxID=2707049 RepID=A0ABV9NRI7_9GAMM